MDILKIGIFDSTDNVNKNSIDYINSKEEFQYLDSVRITSSSNTDYIDEYVEVNTQLNSILKLEKKYDLIELDINEVEKKVLININAVLHKLKNSLQEDGELKIRDINATLINWADAEMKEILDIVKDKLKQFKYVQLHHYVHINN